MVECDGGGVVLSAHDGQVRWDDKEKRWTLTWNWKDGRPPQDPVGSGIGQYSRNKLTPAEEEQFGSEVHSCLENGWLVEHDADIHGEPAAVLPLLVKSQQLKSSTPVRPCLDYRCLNSLIESHPGAGAPVCSETRRKWRVSPDVDYKMLDMRKAYLQVHIDRSLLRCQVVSWRGKLYVMTRMDFGLSVASKFMNIIVRWATHAWDDVDSFVDKEVFEDAAQPYNEAFRASSYAEHLSYSKERKARRPAESKGVPYG